MRPPVRLGFVSVRSCYRGDGLHVDAGLGRLVDALAARVDSLTVALSVAPERHPLYDHTLRVPESAFVPLPYLPSFLGGFHKFVPCLEAIREVERRSDVLVVQLPFVAPLALIGPKKPRVYDVCMDQPAYLRESATYHGVAKRAAVATADAVDLLHRALARRRDARLVTHGEVLLERFGRDRGVSVVSSSILDAEIGSVSRQRPPGRFRVLFVGYLRKEKGFDVLIEAFERLSRRLPEAELTIVGAREGADRGAGPEIERAVAALAERRAVTFLGHKGFGPELFQCYADADVLALPTRSEGTPRVLVEARAFGCPVVATRVGGIPSSVSDGIDGLLVPPGDAAALEAALFRVASDRALRDRLVEGGLTRARSSTVDAFAEAILHEATRL